jgi:molybdopterin/thiamine biosynthesis adenylyltransferase
MKWALRDPARFLRERLEFDRLESEVDWLHGVSWRIESDFTVKVDFDFTVHGTPYCGTLTYPDLFPETPAFIRPRDGLQRWSVHQYGDGGSLCLEWRADNWNTEVTGADLVRSAFKLLSAETNPEHPVPVESAHRLTLGQEARNSERRFVATEGTRAALASVGEGTSRPARVESLMHYSATVLLLQEVETEGGAMQAISDVPAGTAPYFPLYAMRQPGRVYRSVTFDQRTHFAAASDLIEALRAAGFVPPDLPVFDVTAGQFPERAVVLVGNDPHRPRVFELDRADGSVREYDVILSTSSVARQSSEHTGLAELRIGLVGLGSIGSKIAVSLARAGVRRFLLVDDDVLLPENLCRHELSWAAVGLHKTDALKEALELIAPGIQVTARTHRVAGQESALIAAAALKDIGGCDLVIDATANPNVFVRLAAAALAQLTPMVWGELFAGGMGGLIARARPGHDPNPLAVRNSVNEYLGRQPPAPNRDATGYDGDDRQPAIAYDCEIGQIACAMTQLALDTALQRIPSRFPNSAYLLGFRKEWVFDQPFDTRPIEVAGPDWMDTRAISSDEHRNEMARILLDMVASANPANADSAS